MKTPDLSIVIAGIRFKNPVMTASGTFGYGKEFAPFVDLNSLGAIIVKGISLEPSAGNPAPRIVETPSGILNSIGLENIGVNAFVHDKLPFLRTLQTPCIVNIYGRDISEYAELAARINDIDGIAAIEVNISCPNVRQGGILFGTDPQLAFSVIKAVREKTTLPVIAKLSPNVTDICVISKSVEDAGADAISLINTIRGMAIDINTRRPKLAAIVGGLSGPAIAPIALRMVWEVAKTAKVPVIGIGGIMDAKTALEFLICGARAVQIGTANFINPSTTQEVIDGIGKYMAEHNVSDINSLIGTLVT
ncbi:MAG: dihydroorotate dehydrogenase [Pseudomonadota bacterium]